MPWTNGMGTTKELYVSPPGTKVGDASALWRVSMAPVIPLPDKPNDPIPFSPMPGYHRIITVAEGNGFYLQHRRAGREWGDKKLVTLGEGYRFSGEDETNCELVDGAALDLNVIYKPMLVKAEMRLLAHKGALPGNEQRLTVDPNQILMFICLAGENVKVDIEGRGWLTLSQYDSMFYYDQSRVSPFNFRTTLLSRFAAVWVSPAEEESA
jgi:environmental stress-induced protein Ves